MKEKKNQITIKKNNAMDAKNINQFPIREYLAGLNIHPVKEHNYYGMYHSPFREDTNASMKVDYNKNLWIDYGANEGGTLIDLAMRIGNCSSGEAMRLLEQHISGVPSFSFQGNNLSPANHEHAIEILKIQPLTNPALFGYLNERCIHTEIAKQHCSEVHYTVNGKPYFAVGFKNDTGGYELRNKYFKGCTSKNITSVKTGRETCQLFEGFMDYLTFLTMKNWQRSPVDVIVLNSLLNLKKVQHVLSAYKSVATFFDNDEAGKRAVQELKQVCENVNDQSAFYSQHKDLNDYLCHHSEQKQVVKQSPIQQSRVKKKITKGRKL